MKKNIIYNIISNKIFEVNTHLDNITSIIYRMGILKGLNKLIKLGLKVKKDSLFLEKEFGDNLFYQGKIKESLFTNSKIFNKNKNSNKSNKEILIEIYIKNLNISLISIIFSLLKYKRLNKDVRKYYLKVDKLNKIEKSFELFF